MNHRHNRRLLKIALVGGLLALGACESNQPTEPAGIARTDPAPTYPAVAAKYNQRVANLDRFWARAVVRLKYFDEKGDEHNEQGEGLLQVVRPDRMALSLNKAGKRLFWFGGDAARYWLFDVIDKPLVRVGRHDAVGKRRGDVGLGLNMDPREMIRLLCITPLPASAPGDVKPAGTTAWSRDGRFVEVTTPIPTGTQLISLDPATFLPQKISLADRAGKPVINAVLELYEPIEMVGVGGARPPNATRFTAVHPASRTEIKLDLGEMRNDRVSDKAFDFEELKRALGVEQVIDLDLQPRKTAGG